MPRKVRCVFASAISFLIVASISRRVLSLTVSDVADSIPSHSFTFENDLRVEDEPLQPPSSIERESDLDVILDDEEAIQHQPSLPSHDVTIIPAVDPISRPPSKSHPPCFPEEVLLVSTLDGKISALDLDRMEASPLWSVDTGSNANSAPEPLMSSSVAKMVSGATWIVPSLDGILYQFYSTTNSRGEQFLKSTAISSDEILGRSLRLDNDNIPNSPGSDTTIYGSKEMTIIGINARNGHVCYFCDGSPADDGCSAKEAAINDCGLTDDDDVIVVRRDSHSVKALKTRTGEQRWNYSVAQNHLRLVEGPGIRMESHFPSESHFSAKNIKNDVIISTCDYFHGGNPTGSKDLRFDALKGRVTSGKSHFDFEVPIANAWVVSKGKLQSIDLFDSKNIASEARSSSRSKFLSYLGSYNGQYYLQHSSHFHNLISLRNGKPSNYELEWFQRNSGGAIGDESSTSPSYGASKKAGRSTLPFTDNALAIRAPTIIAGKLLEPSERQQLELQIELSKLTGDSKIWRQILKLRGYWMSYPATTSSAFVVSTLVVAIFVGCVSTWLKQDETKKTKAAILSTHPSITDSGFDTMGPKRSDSRSFVFKSILGCKSMPLLPNFDSSPPRPPSKPLVKPLITSPSVIEFDSRFYQDFEPLKCLGKGGFGVVFEAKNRLDDCAYAIKRIALKNKQESKERVRREVMALAKLDHHGIVRYYHAWFESPPVGWDDPFLAHMTSASTDLFSPTSSDLEQVLCTNPNGSRSESTPIRRREEEVMDETGQGDGPKPSKKRLRYESLATKDLIFNNNPEDSLDDDVSLSMAHHDDDDDFDPLATENTDGISFRNESDHSPVKCGKSKFFCRRDSRNLSTPSSPTLKRISSDSGHGSTKRPDVDQSLGLTSPDESFEVVRSLGLTSPDESFDVVFEHSTHPPPHHLQDDTPKKPMMCDSKLNLYCKSEEESDEEFGGPRGFFPILANEDNEKDDDLNRKTPPLLNEKDNSDKIFLYIQMQLCLKETLKDWLRVNLDRKHSIILDLFAQIADAVHFLHNQGLIHRDLKPSNIFFSASDGTIKIGDFGLVTAMVLDNPFLDETHDLAVPTATQVANHHTDQVGTKLYMSPEQSSGIPYCQKVDIYSLGIIFFELLHPFNTEMERGHTLTALRQENSIPEPLRRSKKKESGLLLQMIDKDPSRRPTAEDVKMTVEDLEMHYDENLDADVEPVRGRRRRRSSFSRCSSQSNKSNGSGKSAAEYSNDDDGIIFSDLL